MSSGFDNDTVFCTNVDFRGVSPVVGQFTTDGQMLFGATASPYARVGTPTTGPGLEYVASAGGGRFDLSSGTGIGFANLGISLTAGVFRVQGADAALSSTNRAYVTFPSKVTPGTSVTIPIIADQSFIDDSGASTILGNLFGFIDTVDYAQDVPFFIYAVANDTEDAVAFGISRIHFKSLAPAAASIGKTGSAIADSQFSMFLLDDPTVADYDTNPCVKVGWFKMTKTSGAANDWTVTSLDSVVGMNKNYVGKSFVVPVSSFSATSGSFFLPNGGTGPVFDTTNTYVYQFNDSATITCLVSLVDAGTGAAGAGAVSLLLVTPFYASGSFPDGTGITTNATYNLGFQLSEQTGTNSFALTKVADTVALQNADFTGAAKTFKASFTYIPGNT